MKNKTYIIGKIVVVLLASILFATGCQVPESKSVSYGGKATAKVLHVIDGDTVLVEQSGEKVKVRMIGINTPESVSPNAEENCDQGDIAADFTRERLQSGDTVYLEYDKQKKDKYGRILAYIWLTGNCDYEDYKSFCNYNFGAVLLQNTYCEAVYYEPNGKYKDWYEKLDQEY